MICSVFGFIDVSIEERARLEEQFIRFSDQLGHIHFIVGVNNSFERAALEILARLSQEYYMIDVTAVVTGTHDEAAAMIPENVESVSPDGLDMVIPHYLIRWRNQWMIRQCSCVMLCRHNAKPECDEIIRFAGQTNRAIHELRL